LLEYELPLNFSFDPNLSEVFSALETVKREFLGFMFKKREDKNAWN